MEPSSEGKVVVDELQIEDIPEDNKVITVPEDTRGQLKSLQPKQKLIDLVEQGESAKDPPLELVYQDGRRRMLIKLMEVKAVRNKEVEGQSLASRNF